MRGSYSFERGACSGRLILWCFLLVFLVNSGFSRLCRNQKPKGKKRLDPKRCLTREVLGSPRKLSPLSRVTISFMKSTASSPNFAKTLSDVSISKSCGTGASSVCGRSLWAVFLLGKVLFSSGGFDRNKWSWGGWKPIFCGCA